MASQLRLHVLLPLAVLGLIGAAFGVYTMGKAPGGGGNSGVPLITTDPVKTKPPQAAEEDWALKANAWCTDLASKTKPPNAGVPLEDFETWFGEATETIDSAAATFVELGWPSGEKARVMRLRDDLDRTIKAFRTAFTRFQAGDYEGARRALETADGGAWETNMRQLGATTCAEDTTKAAKAVTNRVAIKPAADLLRAQLARYSKVVVLFYEPGASYDAIQTREARAGALSAHAGFVSVNVSKNREVGQLATQYNVLESPTVLIFTRGLKLKARLEGFYDRTAVIQAVKNA